MSLRHGYQLWILGLTNEAVSFHEQLVSRNSSLLAARAFLKDAYSARRQFKKAVEHARAGYEVSPTSVDWARRYGFALAENERWHRAFTTLRRAADQEPGQTVPVLVYRAPNTCDYPARLSVNKLSEHFSRLAEDEYRFILPQDLSQVTARRKISPDEHNVLIVLLDADRDVVESVEKLLERYDTCAVYAGTRQTLQGIVPSKPKSEDFQRMLQSGRWSLASYGWDETDPDSASAYGARGTPLTHRRVRDGKKESLEEYRARVDRLLRECAESLPTKAPRVLVYPDGNFGQSSLDISPEEIAALQEIVRKHFDYALYFEDPGFITPRHNDFRLPARLVPGDWDGERLMTHLRQRNPVTRAQLDLA